MITMANPSIKRDESLRAWRALKERRLVQNRSLVPAKQDIGTLLEFLGLPYQDENQLTHLESRRGSQRSSWECFRFETDSLLPKVMGAPQFGTRANGVYRIYAVWDDRPHADNSRVHAALEDAKDSGSAILLYFGGLKDVDRQALRRQAWDNGYPTPILDEHLITFLADQQDGNQFQCFLESSLPYTATVPYDRHTAFGAPVAPEMFYGRRELAGDVEARNGGVHIVFGGRQLGKTALLQNIEGRFTRPDRKQFACFVDLKGLGYVRGGNEDTANIFSYVIEYISKKTTLSADIQSSNPQECRRYLENKFKQDTELVVLVMFDEADAFFEADSRDGFQAVEALRALMNSTEGRFKIVFAGLHSVQRYAKNPNSPLYNLGHNYNTPWRGSIGPLGDGPAQDLVMGPSQMLGFRFQPGAVSKLLSYTQRHPALIQFFCHELIRTFRDTRPDARPPFMIETNMIDEIYKDPKIRDGVRSRFNATFELDRRYELISLVMIHEGERPNYPEIWSLDKIREACIGWAEAEAAFLKETLSDSDLRALLDELIGLGVLVPDGRSYRLRSLIVEMFGNRDEIETRILEILDDRDSPGSLLNFAGA